MAAPQRSARGPPPARAASRAPAPTPGRLAAPSISPPVSPKGTAKPSPVERSDSPPPSDEPATVNDVARDASAAAARGQYDVAQALLRQATLMSPDDAQLWYELACADSMAKDGAAGLEHLEKALQLGYDQFKPMEKVSDCGAKRELTTVVVGVCDRMPTWRFCARSKATRT